MYECEALWWCYPNYPLTDSLLAFIPSSHPPILSSVCMSFSGTMHAATIMFAMVRLQIEGEPINPSPSFNFHPPFTPSSLVFPETPGGSQVSCLGPSAQQSIIHNPLPCYESLCWPHARVLFKHMIHCEFILVEDLRCLRFVFVDNDGEFFKQHFLKACPTPVRLPLNLGQGPVSHVFFLGFVSVHGAVPCPLCLSFHQYNTTGSGHFRSFAGLKTKISYQNRWDSFSSFGFPYKYKTQLVCVYKSRARTLLSLGWIDTSTLQECI